MKNFLAKLNQVLRYILNFDVISEVVCILLRGRIFDKKRSNLSQHAIPELLTLYPK